MNKSFTDIKSFDEKNQKIFCYRSGSAVLEEVFEDGVLYSAGTNCAGYPLNVLSNCDTRLNPYDFCEPFSFNAVIDGISVCRNLKFIGFNVSEDGCKSEAIFSDSADELYFHIITIIDGTNVFTRFVEIENKSSAERKISKLVIHGGGLEKTDFRDCAYYDFLNGKNQYDIGYFRNNHWGREGEFEFSPLSEGTTCVDCKFGADRFRHPAVFLRNNISGNMYFIQCGWSGGVRFSFNNDNTTSSNGSALSYSVELTGYSPLYILKPGEKFTSPHVHFCMVHGCLDDAVNEGIKHTRKTVLPNVADLSVGGGMGAEHDMSVETSIAFATQLHEMGAEVFIIDAGWACPPNEEMQWYQYNGINRINNDRYPNDGLNKIREHCRSMGMKFGMWMEPERFGNKSGIKEKHPDWVAKNAYGNKNEGFFDFTNPNVVEWIESEISYIIENYELDLFRLDYNVDGREAFGFNNDGECISLRHYSNVYSMFERIRNKYPNVVFENCAGGGGRTDLGFMKNFNHTWVSDNQKMPRSTEITNGMTMVLPPERVDRLFAGMGCHITGDMKSHIRNTMLTHMSLNVIAPAILNVNSDLMEEIKSSVELYKNEIRPILPNSFIYHHTPTRGDVMKKGYTCLEITSENKEKGFIAAFSATETTADEIVIKPKGINKSLNYSVYLDNNHEEYIVSGRELSAFGIQINLGTSLTSEFIKYSAIK